ncbi:ribosome maturation factor RimP [Clostridium aestuarii]|uniref:Ribosome maturation factor RimP n=1 Tax=Clostridium aestuarii TaxID=338193 RepID=A0ABT4CY62_9CLOT|nr:ribosome maturation factor RimP [Clostridium aestuarii]MCY6483934.1 ribosome maturation factor RimP [Clostridium aestuarii]
MKNDILIDKLSNLVEPIVVQLNYELYHIEYIKENKENYLRIYIDKAEGISLEDCGKVSRKLSDMLDEKDPISESYYLEISSPGIERTLYNDKHLSKYINNIVNIKLSRLYNGQKTYIGKLLDFNNENISIEIENENVSIPKNKIKKITLKGEF